MLEDIYAHNPKTGAIMSAGLVLSSLGLIVAGMMAKKKKNCKILFGMGLAAFGSAALVTLWNRPIGIYGKNPQDVINWLKLEGFTNIPEEEIRKTGQFFWD